MKLYHSPKPHVQSSRNVNALRFRPAICTGIATDLYAQEYPPDLTQQADGTYNQRLAVIPTRL